MRNHNLKVGDKVKHWFAGVGFVKRVSSNGPMATVYCDWGKGGSGGAIAKDLQKLPTTEQEGCE